MKRSVVKSVHGSSRASRILQRVDLVTSLASTACVVGIAVTVFLVVAAAFGFPDNWLTVFYAVAAGVTLIMVFVIQHTQSREQAATQLKLDELIRALPGADDHLVHVEAAGDEELADRTQRDLEHHEAVRDTG
jgi:low affinity Fe/Cu permease